MDKTCQNGLCWYTDKYLTHVLGGSEIQNLKKETLRDQYLIVSALLHSVAWQCFQESEVSCNGQCNCDITG
jgi:hypothetical protein